MQHDYSKIGDLPAATWWAFGICALAALVITHFCIRSTGHVGVLAVVSLIITQPVWHAESMTGTKWFTATVVVLLFVAATYYYDSPGKSATYDWLAMLCSLFLNPIVEPIAGPISTGWGWLTGWLEPLHIEFTIPGLLWGACLLLVAGLLMRWIIVPWWRSRSSSTS